MIDFNKISPITQARIAGLTYLLGSLVSVFGQMIVLGKVIIPGNPTETASNILGNESLFRLGFVSALMTVPFHLLWAVLFYNLFKHVNRSISRLALYTMLVACTMWSISALFYISILSVLKGKIFITAFEPDHLHALSLMLVKINAHAYDIGLVFFGIWCMALGYLIFKSTFIPKVIGILLMFSGLGYLTLLWQPLANYTYPYNLALAGPGEISLLLWLIIKGLNADKWAKIHQGAT